MRNFMTSALCEICADRNRRHPLAMLLMILVSPVLWAVAGLVAVARAVRPRHRRPRLCLLAGTRPTRRETARSLNQVLGELVRFQTRTLLDLVVVQDRISRPDGEPLRAAVQRTRRGGVTLFTIRLALHANRTCYGPEAVAATLADVLVTLYEREAQAAAVLEMPARVPREVPTGLPAVAPTRNGTGSPQPARNGMAKPAAASTHNLNGMVLARAHANEEADGTVTQFKPRPGGPIGNDLT
jgi:hypothetical protein